MVLLQVHVAYQTSGCIAVHDHDALRHLDFAQHLCEAASQNWPDLDKVQHFVRQRKPGQVRHHGASQPTSLCLLPIWSRCHCLGIYTGFPGQRHSLTPHGMRRWIPLFCSR